MPPHFTPQSHRRHSDPSIVTPTGVLCTVCVSLRAVWRWKSRKARVTVAFGGSVVLWVWVNA
ncbi:hypothetical protein F5882DRAFT_402495 [Hyaloscypha sp. PMI_1271]|nr:hypothetical protein F5882DRAFT_402495 [Hyaloscypha sp. PMI_1271]